jgi:hypothetical protein
MQLKRRREGRKAKLRMPLTLSTSEESKGQMEEGRGQKFIGLL